MSDVAETAPLSIDSATTKIWWCMIPVVLVVIGVFFIPFSTSIDGLIAYMAIWALACTPIRRQLIVVFSWPAFWFAIMFILLVGIRTHGGVDVSLHNKIGRIKHYVAFFMPLFLLAPFFAKESYRHYVYRAVIISGLLLAVLFLLIHETSFFHVKLTHFFRHIEPQQSSVILAFAAYLLCVVAHKKQNSVFVRIAALAGIVFFGISLLILQGERVGLVVYIAGLLFFIYRNYGIRYLLPLIVGMLVLGWAASMMNSSWINRKVLRTVQNVKGYVHNLDEQQTAPSNSMSLRLYYYQKGYEYLKQKPWLGYGTGTFNGGQPHVKLYIAFNHYRQTPENTYLAIALQLGLVGLFLFVGFFLFLWMLSNKLIGPEKDIMQGILLISMLASISFPALAGNKISMLVAAVVAACLGSLFGSDNNSHEKAIDNSEQI